MSKKIWCLFSAIILIFAGLLGRLWYVIKMQPAAAANGQSSHTVVVATTRGTIYDRHKRPLVNATGEYRAAVSPQETLLSIIHGATTQQRFDALRDQLAKGYPAVVRLTKPIGSANGLKPFYVPIRYDDRVLAPHIIGYLDHTNQHGVCGIEYGYDDILSSYNGKAAVSFSIDGSGHYLGGVQPVVTDTTNRSEGGVVLTLDKQLQMIIEDVGAQMMKKGAVVVLQPYTGDILAMASFPSYQPHTVQDSIHNNDGALLNRVLSLYDCGSVFKIVTTAAALEKGVSKDTVLSCKGYIDVDGVRFHCHNRLGHGDLSMSQAFAQSCNIYYIQLAQMIGADALYDMVKTFDMQQSITPAASLSAKACVLPDINILKASQAALANLSFGQGYLLTSPLHIAQITATIINGGVQTKPSLLNGIIDENAMYTAVNREEERRILTSDTAEILEQMMYYTVEAGTGTTASVKNQYIGGKTGTAETGQINTNGNRVVQSWFTGFISGNATDYVITVIAEDASESNTKATLIFRSIVNEILSM